MHRYLITTANESSWKFDRPVLFLGEWCRLYGRKHIWSEMDAMIAEPYGIQKEEKERDIVYVQALASQLLVELSVALNSLHNTRHDTRYWNIVIGHWLQRYVAVVFNRYRTLEQALDQYDISGSTVFSSDDYCLATSDSDTFVRACHDDVWNHVLYSNILSFMGRLTVDIDNDVLKERHGFAVDSHTTPARRGGFILKLASNILPKLIRNRDAVISGCALPLKEEFKLQLSFGQCPQLWRTPPLKAAKLDVEKRRRLSLNAENHQGFERFVRDQLAEVIPICYLEGYAQLAQDVKDLPWPARPKFIFTSTRFGADEMFKAWTAAKVEEGVPYYVGQHGNNYGTHLYAGNAQWPERISADKFFSWGWSEEGTNVCPAIIFKQVNRKAAQFNPAGGLLLIERCNPPAIWPWDRYFEFVSYQEDQFRFVEGLSDRVRSMLTVRLHYEHQFYDWFEDQRWHDRSPLTKIDKGATRLSNLISESRIVVHSYDSTGILETLVSNIPTLCFFQEGLDQLSASAKPHYELLKNAGILVETPAQAAEMIERHWDNIDMWWSSEHVQNARKAFCTEYAKMDKYPIALIKQLLSGD